MGACNAELLALMVDVISGIGYLSGIGYGVNKRYRFMGDDLTHFPISDNGRRMGRPPLNVKPTLVRLTDDVRQRIETLVGPNRMAVFIREAIEAELLRRERMQGEREASGDHHHEDGG
ncbi:hypothetical protein [Xanthobacter agilis]|uniref:hypothetical protein n=1 Tax=Xanthobacter agilis TaxID=47492 RepID=UPI00372B291F